MGWSRNGRAHFFQALIAPGESMNELIRLFIISFRPSYPPLIIQTMSMPFTDLLDLIPLPISALGDSTYEQIYQRRFKHFNPIQTQLFHILYHSDCPVLLGAPVSIYH